MSVGVNGGDSIPMTRRGRPSKLILSSGNTFAGMLGAGEMGELRGGVEAPETAGDWRERWPMVFSG